MAGIQATTGLVTGIQIEDTVTKLMSLAARPRDVLQTRTTTLQNEQAALMGLEALLYSTQYVAKNLGKPDVFAQQSVTSSNTAVLTATSTGTPTLGTYQFTPLQMAQSQQWLSSSFQSSSDKVGAGKITFRYGTTVDRSARLETLDGGSGEVMGRIRITDRSGATAEIDLSTARTMDDVLRAINNNTTISVTAEAEGDRIRLTDNTGLSARNLKVQEAGGGTAAFLGIDGIDTADSTALGRDVLRLYRDLNLDTLNDGNGVRIDSAMPDIQYALRDGTTGTIDLSPAANGTTAAETDTTLGDVLDRINAAAGGKFKVEIASDGDRLVVSDLTTGEGTTDLTAINGSHALADLGLDREANGATVTGRRLLAGNQTVLLSSLNGGQGIGELGALQLTDRTGNSATVDLSAAETLEQVADAINGAGLGIRAQLNRARNGLELVDTSGAASGQMIVASGDATNTATRLGIAAQTDEARINSGDMHLKIIAENTQLSTLNGGAGVARGSLTITTSTGQRNTINLSSSNTIGDVIREINRSSVGVLAELNDTGDGIRLRDLGNGAGTLTVAENGTTTARDLHLLGTAERVDIDGASTQVIRGSSTYTLDLDAAADLTTAAAKINAMNAGISATVISDGSSRPYRLSLVSQRAGTMGRMAIDASGAAFSVQETVRSQDAILANGEVGAGTSPLLIYSSSNQFTNALPGVSLTIKQASTSPVSVTVATSDTNLVASAKTFVDNYNKLRQSLKKLTAYDPLASKGAMLTGDSTALRLDTDLSYLLSGRFVGTGTIKSLGELGIDLQDDGTLELDEDKLKSRYAADPNAVKQFFTTATTGFSAKVDRVIENLAGENGSLLSSRLKALDEKIADNQKRIETLNERLASEEERLYLKFYNMELAIGKLKNNLTALNSIQYIGKSSSSSSSSS